MEVVTWDVGESAMGESGALCADPGPLVFMGIELPLVLAQVQAVEVADVLSLLPQAPLAWEGLGPPLHHQSEWNPVLCVAVLE